MPVYSMTGFATASHAAANVSESTPSGTVQTGSTGLGFQVEIRSVNGRFLDLSLRLPDEFRGLEPALREIVTQGVRRGKVELRLASERAGDTAWPQPQPDQLHQLARLENTVQAWLPKAAALSVHEVLNWCRGAAPRTVDETVVLATARRCVEALRESRAREGAKLVDQLTQRVAALRELAARAAPLVPQVVARQQERFVERWQEALAAAGGAVGGAAVSQEQARERALNEAAAYAIRIDVAEELARLAAHLDEIGRLLGAGGEVGKRLDFLIQELHREANTLGSKSAALELTQISVEMRVLIEQMREQVQNIE